MGFIELQAITYWGILTICPGTSLGQPGVVSLLHRDGNTYGTRPSKNFIHLCPAVTKINMGLLA